MYVKNPNLPGEENINLTKEYLQEKVSFQPDLVEEEDNKVCFEYFRNLLLNFLITNTGFDWSNGKIRQRIIIASQ